jgi:hypothetical protein
MKKPPPISVSDAMASPKLFAPFFTGPSWDTWRAVIKAMFAEKMTAAEIDAFRAVAERDPPQQRVSEAVFVCGRGAGKDSVASLIAAHIAITFDPKGSKLRPGEVATILCLAVDREQAAIVLNYIRAYFEQVPALAALVKSIDRDGVTLHNRVALVVGTNSYRSVRGRTIICAIFDEVAFWRDENSATPDVETAGAVAPGLGRIPGSMLILISTAHRRSGLLYQKWKDHYGRDDDHVLCVRGSTLQFNPTFDAKVIERQLASDPQLYGAEYLSQWRDDLATFISRDLLEAAVDVGVIVRPPIDGVLYLAFTDASGGVGDSFTLGIAHRDKDGSIVLDLLFEKRAPFNPYEVTEEIAALLKTYHCTQVVGDSYGAKWVSDAFIKAGIAYRKSEMDRSAIYLNALPLFTSGRAHLIDNPRLVAQFAALERRTFSTGRDRVDHGRTGRDDAANSAAGALVLAARRMGQEMKYFPPYVWSKTSGVISDPCPGTGKVDTTAEFYRNGGYGGGYWPGSGPREW